MTIRFNTPPGDVQEWIIDDLKKKLTEFHQKDAEITAAHVSFHKRPIAFDGDYNCEIELVIGGSSIMVQRSANSYLQATRKVLEELNRIIEEQIEKQRQNEPPNIILTTVEV